ncbi:unnamed protein product [Peniophora sp. CBMAI 1063]|nr:unnamed protein product [Peniophora sp. CBMAI 1063]
MARYPDCSRSPIQAARRYYLKRDLLLGSVSMQKPKAGKGGRKTGRTGYARRQLRKKLLVSGDICEYDLKLVMRRTTLDSVRTPAITANEYRIWDDYSLKHKEWGSDRYKSFLFEEKERLELEACALLTRRSASTGSTNEEGPESEQATRSFYALRRLVAIVLQERDMLDMTWAQLQGVGYDGTFIALGRCIVKSAFRAEAGWYTEKELLRYRGLATDTDSDFDSDPDSSDA